MKGHFHAVFNCLVVATVYRLYMYTGWPKKVSHYQMIKNRIKSMRLDLFVKLSYESSTIILFVGIRYYMRDLLSDLNNYA